VCAAALATGFAAGLCTDAVRLVVGLTASWLLGKNGQAEPVEGGFTPTATFTLVIAPAFILPCLHIVSGEPEQDSRLVCVTV